MKIDKRSGRFKVLSTDITNHCNSRCIFCFNDWEKCEAAFMSEEVLSKVLSALDFFEDLGAYFSCLFEPTIHPRYKDYMAMVPENGRQKMFFTTNLVRKMEDDDIRAMLNASFHHINISLETYDPQLYTYLSGRKMQSFFYDNLASLGRISREMGIKKHRIVSMLLKSNYEEMISLIKRVHNEIDPLEHEIRTPYFFKGPKDVISVFEKELLSRREIDEKYEEIKALGYDNILFEGTMDLETYEGKKTRRIIKTDLQKRQSHTDFYTVRVDANGSGKFWYDGTLFDVNDIPDFNGFLREHMDRAHALEAKSYLAPEKQYEFEHTEEPLANSLDEAALIDGRFLLLRGWESLSLKGQPSDGKRFIIIENGDIKRVYIPESLEREDVAGALSDDSLRDCGYYILIDTADFDMDKPIKAYSAYAFKNSGVGSIRDHFKPHLIFQPLGDGILEF